ncbi:MULTISPECIES: DUF4429 domain-containing protein [unclassified Lysinibacillus]|uniref:DUF4429 domain-containing protein n=1 Tax=unclassified Lysinibacillus TaxID=2636778 RepID=UPI002554165E|nr:MULTISPECIES: DUF4429 domain-containing protein [unclassified Lysinibacillus]MDM5248803.1 SHOCT domain-containing protein [Lysinibacillus sp. G4S2]
MSKVFEFKSNGKFIVTVDDYNVKIQPKGFSNFINKGGSKGEKSIPIKSITAIQFKEPGLTTGYVQFAYSGSSETKGGTMAAVKDENTITFVKKELKQAREMVDLIESKRQTESTPSKNSSVSAADEILKMKELLDAGILTQDEFDTKKKQLLGI